MPGANMIDMPVAKVVDLSNWNDRFDMAAFRANGGNGVICQVEVPLFNEHMKAAEGEGLLLGAYRWGYAGRNPVDEANRFVAACGGFPMDLGYWLDSETTDGQSPGGVVAFDNAFQHQVQSLTSRLPGTYTSPGLWATIAGNSTELAWTLLWGADYGVSSLPNFGGWTRHAGWQFTDKAYEGSENVDESWFDLGILGAPLPPTIGGDMSYPQAVDMKSGGTWTVTPDGGVQTDDGAPFIGAPIQHPEWHSDPAVAASWWHGDGTDAHGNGFKVTTDCAQHGTLHYYRFSRDGAQVPKKK